jgi:Fe-S cluster biogenesis protein NfuA
MTPDERQDWIAKVDIALNDVRPHLAIDGGNIEVLNSSVPATAAR